MRWQWWEPAILSNRVILKSHMVKYRMLQMLRTWRFTLTCQGKICMESQRQRGLHNAPCLTPSCCRWRWEQEIPTDFTLVSQMARSKAGPLSQVSRCSATCSLVILIFALLLYEYKRMIQLQISTKLLPNSHASIFISTPQSFQSFPVILAKIATACMWGGSLGGCISCSVTHVHPAWRALTAKNTSFLQPLNAALGAVLV